MDPKLNDLTWNEVARLRGKAGAFQIRHGRMESILCGDPGHSDLFLDGVIVYSIPRRTYYQRGIQAMEACLGSDHLITVFRRLAKNKWRNLGEFRVRSSSKTTDAVLFELVQGGQEEQLR